MNKRKLFAVLGAVTILLLVVASIWWFMIREKKPVDPAFDGLPKELVASADILKAFNEKRYDESIKKAKAYAADDKNSVTNRLNTWSLCVEAARNINDNSSKDYCYKQAQELANKVQDENEKKAWLAELDRVYKNEKVESNDNGSQ